MNLQAVSDPYMTPAQIERIYVDVDGEPMVTRGQLAQWRYTRQGPPYLKVGGRVYYAKSEFENYIGIRKNGSEG